MFDYQRVPIKWPCYRSIIVAWSIDPWYMNYDRCWWHCVENLGRINTFETYTCEGMIYFDRGEAMNNLDGFPVRAQVNCESRFRFPGTSTENKVTPFFKIAFYEIRCCCYFGWTRLGPISMYCVDLDAFSLARCSVQFSKVAFWLAVVSTVCIYIYIHVCVYIYYTSSTAQGGGGSFKIGNL